MKFGPQPASPLYPVQLRLSGRRCVVVGGGSVAARKVSRLLASGAQIHVISPTLCEGLEAARADLRWSSRDYRPGDLSGADLAVAATDSAEVNRAVWREARERGVWVNVVDEPALCDFQVPSLLQRGCLTVTVSTSGACPALSRKLRHELEKSYPPAYSVYVDLLAEARSLIHSMVPDETSRRDLLEEVLEMPVDFAALAAPGERQNLRRRILLRLEQGRSPRPERDEA